MSTLTQDQDTDTTTVDAVVVGAGFAGLGMLRRFREMGLDCRLFEAGSGVGGVWHWNRYPGARTDCEAWVYCFQFSRELLQDWTWEERYPSQPEMERYLGAFADRYDLRGSISLGTRVTSAVYDEESGTWTVTTDRGDRVRARYVVLGLGILSKPKLPEVEGVDAFAGETLMTATWPDEPVSFVGKRVGLVGTGASGIQVLPFAAAEADAVHVFQRTPNYIVPTQNHPIDAALDARIKAGYGELLETAAEHSFALPIAPKGRSAKEATPEQLREVYEAGWEKGGFHFLFDTFDDVLVDIDANLTAQDFIRGKIREVVEDPETAEKLCPQGYAFGSKRPPSGTGYFESFNRDSVTLVDLNENPIERVVPEGIVTKDGLVELDMIIWATGFDAVTGSIKDIDLRGRGGVSISDHWHDKASAYLGLATAEFPNLFTITGPTAPFSNIPAVIEKHVEVIGDLVAHTDRTGGAVVEATAEAEAAWYDHAAEVAQMTVVPLGDKVNSWLTGSNVAGKPTELLFYMGGYKVYNDRCAEIAAADYEGFVFTPIPDTAKTGAQA